MQKDIQRLFFLVRDEPVCDDIETSLIEFGVDEDRIFIYDSLSEDLIALPEQNEWERNRRIPMVVWGVIFGALAGFTSAFLREFADPGIPQDLYVLVTVVGAILGGIMFQAAAGNEHEKRLQEFQDSIYQRGLMLVADVPRQGYRRIHQQIVARHAAQYLGSINRASLQQSMA
jgi:uncharacterized membrane protein YeaQ/YmgE (transglycosylase-associated protein family)